MFDTPDAMCAIAGITAVSLIACSHYNATLHHAHYAPTECSARKATVAPVQDVPAAASASTGAEAEGSAPVEAFSGLFGSYEAVEGSTSSRVGTLTGGKPPAMPKKGNLGIAGDDLKQCTGKHAGIKTVDALLRASGATGSAAAVQKPTECTYMFNMTTEQELRLEGGCGEDGM